MVEGIQHKLLIKLLRFNYSIEYKKGKDNRVADALSRLPVPSPAMALSIIQPVPHYTLMNGIIRFHGKLVIGTASQLRTQLLNSFHQSALGGHSGERATYQRLKLIFYWNNMKQDVINYVKQCPVCQKNKSENTPYPGLLQPLPVPEK